MQINAVAEFNQDGHLIYADNFIGAYVRGKTQQEALQKFPHEIAQYCRWLGCPENDDTCAISIVQQKQSQLQICDADSDVLFDSELPPLSMAEFQKLSALASRSAKDFEVLYRSIPLKNEALVAPRKTFYGMVPSTAEEMYRHTKNVNEYYFGEIGISADNEPDIYACRLAAFRALQQQPDFLDNAVFDGSYGEQWSLRKVCRRFIWHDRIHAKAMFRAAAKLYGKDQIANPFCFE